MQKVPIVLNKNNIEIQFIQSLKLKKYRHKNTTFIAEGENWFNEVIVAKASVIHIYTSNQNIYNTAANIKDYQHNVTLINEKTLDKISQQKTPNKVVCLLPFFKHQLNTKILQKKFTLVCDDIRDPGNLGTIIRTACWFGIEQVILSESCVDVYNPKVVQASMGTLMYTKIIYQNLESLFKENKKTPVYASSLKGEELNKNESYPFGFIVVGNEAKGISKKLLQLSTHHLKIKGRGKAESLNAAVATGIILNSLIN